MSRPINGRRCVTDANALGVNGALQLFIFIAYFVLTIEVKVRVGVRAPNSILELESGSTCSILELKSEPLESVFSPGVGLVSLF